MRAHILSNNIGPHFSHGEFCVRQQFQAFGAWRLMTAMHDVLQIKAEESVCVFHL